MPSHILFGQLQADPLAGTTAVMNALVASLAAVAVFAAVWRVERDAWLGWLIVTWLLWSARYIVGLGPQSSWPMGSGALGSQVGTWLFLLRDAAFVLALYHLGARWAVPFWLFLLVPLGLGVLGVPAMTAFAENANAWLFVQRGLLWVVGAVVFGSTSRLEARARYLAAAGLLVHAIVAGGSAWPGNQALSAEIGIGLSSVVHLAVALGVGIGVHKRLLDEREAAELRVARALEFAVRGMVPMCAHCRSVRAPDDRWLTLEAFVEQRTGSPVTDQRCPECEARATERAVGAPAVRAT